MTEVPFICETVNFRHACCAQTLLGWHYCSAHTSFPLSHPIRVTGHQKLIKNYKDVRLQGLEICAVTGHLKVMLSASGSWDDVQTQVAPQGAGGSLPGSIMQSPLMMSPYGSPAMAVAQLLFAQQQQQNQLLAQPDLAALLGMPGSGAGGAPGFPGFMDSNVLAAFAAAVATEEGQQAQGVQEQQQQQGEAEGTTAANIELAEGDKQDPDAAPSYRSADPDAAMEASTTAPEPLAAGASEEAVTAVSSAEGQTMDIAAALAAMNAMQQQQQQLIQAPAADNVERDQAGGSEPQQSNAAESEVSAADSQAALDAAAAAGLQHLLQASGALNFNIQGGNDPMAMLQVRV
jgi:hypothetical protein